MNDTENNIILSVQDLDVRFTLRGRTLHAIRGVSLDVYAGESLAIVGESGSGKSVFVKTFMGLLDANGSISGGSILYGGQDLTQFRTDKDWLKIRGHEIAMVLQDPMTSLNPLKTIGKQIQEAVELHQGLKGAAARQAVLEVLSDVGIDEPERRATYAAVISVIALVDVPICYMVTRLIPSSIHPVVLREGGMSADMGMTVAVVMAGMCMVGFGLYRLRFRQVRLAQRVEAMKEQLED